MRPARHQATAFAASVERHVAARSASARCSAPSAAAASACCGPSSRSGAGDAPSAPSRRTASAELKPTNVDLMAPGAAGQPEWTSGSARPAASSTQYENEREEQGRLNRDRQAFEDALDAALRGAGAAADLRRRRPRRRRVRRPSAPLPPPRHLPAGRRLPPATRAPRGCLRRRRRPRRPAGHAAGHPRHADSGRCRRPVPPQPALVRVTLVDRPPRRSDGATGTPPRRRRADRRHLPARQLHPRRPARRPGCAHRRPVADQPAPGADPPVRQLGAAQPLPRRVPRVLRDRRRLRRHQLRARLPAHREPVLRARRRRGAGSEDPGQRLRRGRQGRHARPPRHQAGPDARQRAAGRRGQRHRPGHLATSSTSYSTSALGHGRHDHRRRRLPRRPGQPASARRSTGWPSTTSSWPKTPSR